ncbi:MAG: phosphopantetheine-binding protein [Caldilineaceae bacterium]
MATVTTPPLRCNPPLQAHPVSLTRSMHLTPTGHRRSNPPRYCTGMDGKAVTVPPQGLVQQVLTTIASVLDLDECQIAPQARLREDLGADSLDLAEMIVALGQALDITICDHEVCTITTVGEVLAYLAQPQPVHRVHHGRYLKEDDANDPSNDY